MALISVPTNIDHNYYDFNYLMDVPVYGVNHWYEDGEIYLNRLSNECLDDLEIPENLITCLRINTNNPNLDIDRFLEKFENRNITRIVINENCTGIIISRLPKTLMILELQCNVNISNIPDTLNEFIVYNYTDPIRLPVISNNVKYVSISGCNFGDSDLNLPSSVEILRINLNTFNTNFSNWPCNLKELTISQHNTKYSSGVYAITMLPVSLRKLTIEINEIPFFLDLPPLLEYLNLNVTKPYSYTLENNIPDSVELLRVRYDFCPNMHTYEKLPAKCRTFNYILCPADVFKVLTKKYKKIKVYLRDSTAMLT
jgi:hypothetical protein